MVWNYNKMKWANAQGTVSPRYWILFPAIFLMIVASFTELGCNGKSIYKGFSDLYKETVNALQVRRGLGEKYVVDADIIDPAPDEDQVPLWAWAGGLVAVIILTVAVMAKAFQLDVGVSILAILLGFIFSFIGVQCSVSLKVCDFFFQNSTNGAFESREIPISTPFQLVLKLHNSLLVESLTVNTLLQSLLILPLKSQLTLEL